VPSEITGCNGLMIGCCHSGLGVTVGGGTSVALEGFIVSISKVMDRVFPETVLHVH